MGVHVISTDSLNYTSHVEVGVFTFGENIFCGTFIVPSLIVVYVFQALLLSLSLSLSLLG